MLQPERTKWTDGQNGNRFPTHSLEISRNACCNSCIDTSTMLRRLFFNVVREAVWVSPHKSGWRKSGVAERSSRSDLLERRFGATSERLRSSLPLGQNHGDGLYSSASPGGGRASARCAVPSTRTLTGRFSLKYSRSPLTRGFFERCIMKQTPPKFSSNTRLTKGMLCPEKSIRSIKSSTVP